MQPSKCINCQAVPVVTEQRGHYKFMLSHPRPTTCPADFQLESHQHTAEACVADWNAFNKSNRKDW